MKTTNLLLFCTEAGFAFLIGRCGGAPWTGIAAFETRFFAVSHCRSRRGHTFCVNRKYAKNHKRGGDCVFPAPFETPPLNRQRGTVRGSPLNPSKGWQSFSKPASFLYQVYFLHRKSPHGVTGSETLRKAYQEHPPSGAYMHALFVHMI